MFWFRPVVPVCAKTNGSRVMLQSAGILRAWLDPSRERWRGEPGRIEIEVAVWPAGRSSAIVQPGCRIRERPCIGKPGIGGPKPWLPCVGCGPRAILRPGPPVPSSVQGVVPFQHPPSLPVAKRDA